MISQKGDLLLTAIEHGRKVNWKKCTETEQGTKAFLEECWVNFSKKFVKREHPRQIVQNPSQNTKEKISQEV